MEAFAEVDWMTEATAEWQLISAGARILAAAEAGSEQARERIPKLIEEFRRRYIAPLVIASAYYNARDPDSGFAWVQKACTSNDCGLVWLNVQPEQADPSIGGLMRQIGLRE